MRLAASERTYLSMGIIYEKSKNNLVEKMKISKFLRKQMKIVMQREQSEDQRLSGCANQGKLKVDETFNEFKQQANNRKR